METAIKHPKISGFRHSNVSILYLYSKGQTETCKFTERASLQGGLNETCDYLKYKQNEHYRSENVSLSVLEMGCS